MGNFLYGGKRPTSITYQGKDVQTLKYNGVTVWQRYVPVPAGSQKVTASFTVPARVTVVKIEGISAENGGITTAYVKVTPGKKYVVACGDQYDERDYNDDIEVWWTGYRISIGKFSNMNMGGNYSDFEDEVTISWSEEINKHATNGSAD